MLALQKTNPSENKLLISHIHSLTQLLQQQGRSLTFNWIPSHTNIEGNGMADELAKQALFSNSVHITIQPSISQLKTQINKHQTKEIYNNHKFWVNNDSYSANWYAKATNLLPHPISRHINRKLAVTIHRLQLGYQCCFELIENNIKPCVHCKQLPSNPLLHYLLECPHTRSLRAGDNTTYNINNVLAHTQAPILVLKIIDNLHLHSTLLTSHPPPR